MPSQFMTTKRWAQSRNFGKYKVSGIVSSLRYILAYDPITQEERTSMEFALYRIEGVLNRWDERNRRSKTIHTGIVVNPMRVSMLDRDKE